ncbi:oleate hydratase [Leuconostoc falkenbergense]|jgi:oleate hydratase|uniref:Oleate hydratase n=2 Tax=Leuconostoc TaxID=1243 RepID=A0A1X0VGL5_LEUPS|nr:MULTISPECIES: oleate hydratase [Leuconostoc]KDA48409.1 Myosin-crossreactive antigen [Leuconostoc pseudomesenteroides 1159]KDA50671.1 Myosin-crossreactive antigen [Leuconostoc pseudomesenteroides PS12]MCT4388872.1 oleate hydratase [Leuconostoc falkenbergense]MCT4411023.1 oleate hydratase [Leuconostoc falkenbergense]MCX7578568.1 oleate hydratase [Leuconostoc falkenbergense]
MYYSNGNYEAFATPRKPKGVDQKSAYIVGSGLAGLSAAVFLIRDGQMKGEAIHILEELPLAGGSLDGIARPNVGFVTRGGREMENHFECLWDLYRSIPSLEIPGASYLDEYYWLDKDDPNSSNCRLIYDRGNRVPDDGDYTLGKSSQEIIKLIMTPEAKLGTQTIEDYFSDAFFESNFWTYWATMFAFEKWHSAVEMRRYAMRFIHHIDGLPDFSALKFNKYNQYDSMVLPLIHYLEDHGVDVQFDTTVDNIIVDFDNGQKVAKSLELTVSGQHETRPLTANDLVFVTNGSITESTTYGSHFEPAPVTTEPGGSWQLWENLAAQSDEFGHPSVFYQDLPAKSWFVSATATIENTEIDPYIERLTKRDLHDGKINTGGIITITDSNWLMSFAVHRQPHFKTQKPNETTVWIYGLYSDVPGNYVKKTIVDCSGEEITQELLYHLGVPESKIQQLSKQESINTVPVYMPFITSYFMPRVMGDRPKVIPDGSVNLAFIGNFAESPSRDTVFTTEYSVRTAMEAVYSLLDVERGVPEVFNSIYDIRELLRAMYYMNDKKAITDMNLPIPKLIQKVGMKKIKGTWLEELLVEAHLM